MSWNTETNEQSTSNVPRALVVIGANTGGPAALSQIIPRLPQSLPASVIVIQQMRPGFTALLTEQLVHSSDIGVREAVNNHQLITGEAVIIPGGCGVTIVKHETLSGKTFHIELQDLSGSLEKHRTKVDNAMRSAAEMFGSLTIGVVLTGIGDDGREGIKAIHSAGGKTIAQDDGSSILFDMPRAAIDSGAVDDVLPLYNIADRITELVGESYAGFLQKAAG